MSNNRKLYSFRWMPEGFNQVWADNKAQARKLMLAMGKETGLVPEVGSLKLVKNVNGYFNSFPPMD